MSVSNPSFRIIVVSTSDPRTTADELRVSLEHPESNPPEAIELYLPALRPSQAAAELYAEDPSAWFDFRQLYLKELQSCEAECEHLRQLACERTVALCDSSKNVSCCAAQVVSDAVTELECQRRWNKGWILGGFTYAIRDQVVELGGLWYDRHKVWVMPDKASTHRVRSIWPGEF